MGPSLIWEAVIFHCAFIHSFIQAGSWSFSAFAWLIYQACFIFKHLFI